MWKFMYFFHLARLSLLLSEIEAHLKIKIIVGLFAKRVLRKKIKMSCKYGEKGKIVNGK